MNLYVAAVYLFALISAVQTYLVIVLLARRAWRSYPAFLVYACFTLLRTELLFCAGTHTDWYQPLLFITGALEAVLLGGVALEVFAAVFRSWRVFPARVVAAYFALVGIVYLGALFYALYKPAQHLPELLAVNNTFSRTITWVLCAAYGFMSLFGDYFGLHWRHRVYGIGLGFLAYFLIAVGTTTAIAHYGRHVLAAASLIEMLGFIVALVVWMYYWSAPDLPPLAPTRQQLKRAQHVARTLELSESYKASLPHILCLDLERTARHTIEQRAKGGAA